MKIGEILVQDKVISKDELDFCIGYKKTNPKLPIGAILKFHGFIDDLVLAQKLSKQIGYDLFLGPFCPDQMVIDKVGIDLFINHQIYPLKNGINPSFVLSYVDNVKIIDLIKHNYGFENIKFYIGPESFIRNALDTIIFDQQKDNLFAKSEELKLKGEEYLSPWLDNLIQLAILHRASDIHIESREHSTEIRFRIDGDLTSIDCLKPEYVKPLANILLNRCKGNPGDFKAQDGKFGFKYVELNKTFDIRFSQLPSIFGPSLVLRILDKAKANIPLSALGYSEFNLKLINQALLKPEGMILVCGPTGSGKTTTLASILNKIKSLDKKAITLEDPSEYTQSLTTQTEVDVDQGYSFSTGLRSIVRHDPDIIFVGEIRDHETAEIASHAAMTGHLLLSTIHSSSNLAAILRLLNLGVKSIDIAESLVAVISQRLVRKLCPECKTSLVVNRDRLEKVQAKYLTFPEQRVFKANGCMKCLGKGYIDRTVVSEVLLIDEEIALAVGKDALVEIKVILNERKDYRTILDDMKELVLKGDTSLEEAIEALG